MKSRINNPVARLTMGLMITTIVLFCSPERSHSQKATPSSGPPQIESVEYSENYSGYADAIGYVTHQYRDGFPDSYQGFPDVSEALAGFDGQAAWKKHHLGWAEVGSGDPLSQNRIVRVASITVYPTDLDGSSFLFWFTDLDRRPLTYPGNPENLFDDLHPDDGVLGLVAMNSTSPKTISSSDPQSNLVTYIQDKFDDPDETHLYAGMGSIGESAGHGFISYDDVFVYVDLTWFGYPGPPQDLTYTPYNGHPKLMWESPWHESDEIVRYDVHRKLSIESTYSVIAQLQGEHASYVDEDIDLGQKGPGAISATYYVTALNFLEDQVWRESDPSNTKTVWTNMNQKLPEQPSDQAARLSNVPNAYALNTPYPNPFNAHAEISFAVPELTTAELEVYNTNGRLVSTLARAEYHPGIHAIKWDGTDAQGTKMPSGVYFVSFQTRAFHAVRRIALVR